MTPFVLCADRRGHVRTQQRALARRRLPPEIAAAIRDAATAQDRLAFAR